MLKKIVHLDKMNIAKCESQLQDGIDSETGYTQHTNFLVEKLLIDKSP